MDYRRLSVAMVAQAAVFAAGAVALLALDHALYATSLLCLLAAMLVTYFAATQILFRPRHDIPRRQGDAGAIYTAELSRRRLQVLLDQTPSPLLLLPDDGQV
ncbi:MAG: ATP-binding protein, partial [Asticcacaulis sp.]|nr:ATP-binding protein [Asticcacaulis sp.]